MIRIPKLSEEEEKQYVNLLKPLIELSIKNKRSPAAKELKVANKDFIEQLLLAQPEELLTINDNFFNQIKSKGLDINKAKNDLKNIFTYDTLVKKNHTNHIAYKIARFKNTNTCPYCNRNYCTTVDDVQKSNYVVRPDFDHWLAKSKYPLLALSFYNLIPSCPQCNRSLKHTRDFMDLPGTKIPCGTFDQRHYIHPYIEAASFSFTYRLDSVDSYRVAIKDKHKLDKKTIGSLNLFKIEEIYNVSHSQFELKELIELNNRTPEGYINQLIKDTMSGARMSRNEIYRALFGTEYDLQNDSTRPLSKFKRDIISELIKK